MKKKVNIFNTIVSAGKSFIDDDIMTSAAALAFYSALALAPLVLLSITVSGFLGYNSQEFLIKEFDKVTGAQGGQAISMIISSADKDEDAGFTATIISLIVLAFSASAVFGQLQVVLNQVFDVKPAAGGGIMLWLRRRLFSMGMVFSLAFLMVASLIITAALAAVFSREGILWAILQVFTSIGIFSFLFSGIFKFMPDIYIAWKDAVHGAVVTSLLFSLGHTGISFYLGSSALGSAYGAAGSLIVALSWVYYSSLIVFFGAELTKVIAENYGSGIQPATGAEKI